jgi:hypothetical protein
MRNTLILVFIAIAATSHAQFTLQTSNTTADLRGIHSIGGGVAWASGTNGTVLRTEDGGYVWQSCTVPAGAEKLDFRGIQAFDANTAIVMSSGTGDLSRLYKTTDGCHSWKLVFTNPDRDGFWDAIAMTDRNIGMLIGVPVLGGQKSEATSVRESAFVFPTYHTVDGGVHWKRNDHGEYSAHIDNKSRPAEAIFAASNSSMLLLPYVVLFATGGARNGLHYSQYFVGSAPKSCGYPCDFVSESSSKLASGETAGGFSLASNYKLFDLETQLDSRTVVVVGGDFKMPERTDGTSARCRPEKEDSVINFHCEASATLPHGYRSAVAYDSATKTWITVGPNGTDISTDDGKNWRAVRPDAARHETADADRNWNALSLPFVVGPHGRIGKLDEAALKR